MSEEIQVARRCTICGLSLPDSLTWEQCPKCGEKTDIITPATPDTTTKEATSLLRAREFQEYLEEEGIE